MRFAIAVLACALAVANAQYNRGAFNNQYNRPGQYNPFQGSQYNRYQQYNQVPQYNKYPTNRPYVNTTPYAKAVASVSVTPAPAPVPVPAPAPVVKVAPPTNVVSVAKVAADSRSAETLKYGYDISPEGSYNYFFETNNGIAAQQQGTPRNFGGNPPVVPDVAQGSFSWVAPEGKTISVTYVADENGYQPQSDALPVPPPVPAQIQRALEYVARYAKN